MTNKKKVTEVNVEELNATQYFNYLKEKKQTVTDKDLKDLYNGYLLLVEKYSITGQKRVIEKLRFLADNIEKEMQVVGLGINSFVYRDDIEDYIDNISKNVVKIIELENYPRDIPDNIVQVIAKTKNIFDKMYVVFTDYTGKAEKEVAKERREKDPMLFGTFQKPRTDTRNGGVVFIPNLVEHGIIRVKRGHILLVICGLHMRTEIIASRCRAHPAGEDV